MRDFSNPCIDNVTDPPIDFISIELERGIPRLLIDFGSGTLELKVKPKKNLDDGEWHRLDIFWNTEVSRCSLADFPRKIVS